MAVSGMTNKGAYLIGELFAQGTWAGGGAPTNFYLALGTSATTPTADTNTMDDITQIAVGNGYSDGGYQLSRNDTDLPITEDDANDKAYIVVTDVVFSASGGGIPDSGDGALWCFLTDDNAAVSARNIIAYAQLDDTYSVTDGNTLTVSAWNLDFLTTG